MKNAFLGVNTRNRRAIGFAIIVGSLGATLLIWLFTLSSYDFIQKDPFLFLSKLVVLIGTVALCWTFILATRLKILESLFGGLDKVYHVHKDMGKISFFLIFLHPFFQFFRYVPNWSEAFGLFIPKEFGAVEYGLVAFVLFTSLIAFTLWINIPYHIWKRTHEFFIVVLALTFFHVFFINKQVNASLLLSGWLYGFMALAALSYFYIRFLYRFIGPRYEYVVEKIEKIRQKTWNVYLRPKDERQVDYSPGQFLYVAFNNDILGKEVHPYSVSSYPEAPTIRFSIKNLGDYTAKLDSLKVGDLALLWGPYGLFYEKYLYEKNRDAVMIAGGIGITPFLSMLGHEAFHPSQRKTYVFYCVKDESRADFKKELEAYSLKNPLIRYIPYYADTCGFLDVEKVREYVGDLKNKNFFLCGPKPMMDSFIDQLRGVGVKNYRIAFEDFNLFD